MTRRSIWSWFEDVAARQPNAPALSNGTASLSYADLRARAGALARRIIAADPDGTTTAIVLPHAREVMIATLACLAVGRVALLVNADQPVDRIAQILADGRPGLVIGVSDVPVAPNRAASGTTGWIEVDQPPSVADADVIAPDLLRPDDPGMIIYTSGSSGKPKGVATSQRAMLHRIRLIGRAMHLSHADRLMPLHLLPTAAGLIFGLTTLLAGAHLIVVPIGSPGTLLEAMERNCVTALTILPSLLRVLLQADNAARAIASLRVVRTAGEGVLRDDVRAWFAVLPPHCYFNHSFGQTEASVTSWFVPRKYIADNAALPSGYIAPGHEYVLLDEQGEPVTDGMAGELVLRSAFLASGEWQDGRLVPGRVRADPDRPDLRVVRTGDVVRLDPDGLLHFASRGERRIKVRGQRVEPAEVEEALRRAPGVADAVVLPHFQGESAILYGCVTGQAGTPDIEVIYMALRRSLPSYMVPSRLLVLDQFPRLPSGKIDRTALLARAAAAPAAPAAPAAATPVRGTTLSASSQATALVARSWVHVLDRASLRTEQSFATAGGDSLKLLQLLLHLEKQCGQSLPLDRFDDSMRPADIARALDLCLTPPVDEEVPAVFVLPGVGGGEARLARFRAACAPTLRIDMLPYGDWHSWAIPGFDFPTLVNQLADTVTARRPNGALLLAGYSMGGLVAFELVRELGRRGRSIAYLGLLDTAASTATDARRGKRHWAGEVARLWQRRVAGGGVDGVAMVLARLLSTRPAAPLLRRLACRPPVSLPRDLDLYLRRAINLWMMGRMTLRWRGALSALAPLPDVPVSLFRSHHANRTDPDGALGWSGVCGNLRVIQVMGDHYTMFDEPHLAGLRDHFAASVAEVEAALRAAA